MAGPLLNRSSPSLGGTEQNAGDTLAPIKNGVKILPPASRHLALDSNEIVETLGRHGVHDGVPNRL